MPRPRGSKNKVTMTAAAPVDYAALIDEKQSAKDSLNAEVTSIAANIDSLKADLKSKKAEELVANALANGMTAEEITELLK